VVICPSTTYGLLLLHPPVAVDVTTARPNSDLPAPFGPSRAYPPPESAVGKIRTLIRRVVVVVVVFDDDDDDDDDGYANRTFVNDTNGSGTTCCGPSSCLSTEEDDDDDDEHRRQVAKVAEGDFRSTNEDVSKDTVISSDLIGHTLTSAVVVVVVTTTLAQMFLKRRTRNT
jgi:hypothetical protein